MRSNKLILLAFFNGLHELVGYSNRNIEVIYLVIVFFTVNKLENIGVVNPKHTHVCAAACSALLDRFGCGVKHFHKAYRTGSNTAGRAHDASLRTEA